MTIRIAMWSGPRNISTALMRAFEARGDCHVVDEPLYAAYLHRTGKEHPGREAILASQPTDPEEALDALAHPTHGKDLQFEKHMAQHWQPDWPFAKLEGARHAFLIRDPALVVASYTRVREQPEPEDLGTLQQAELVDAASRAGQTPVVIDGDEIRADPAAMLRKLCKALSIPYVDRMLGWAPGPRPTDGAWAPYWYDRVEASTGFSPPDRDRPPCPPELADIAAILRPHYRRLASLRIRPTSGMG